MRILRQCSDEGAEDVDQMVAVWTSEPAMERPVPQLMVGAYKALLEQKDGADDGADATSQGRRRLRGRGCGRAGGRAGAAAARGGRCTAKPAAVPAGGLVDGQCARSYNGDVDGKLLQCDIRSDGPKDGPKIRLARILIDKKAVFHINISEFDYNEKDAFEWTQDVAKQIVDKSISINDARKLKNDKVKANKAVGQRPCARVCLCVRA